MVSVRDSGRVVVDPESSRVVPYWNVNVRRDEWTDECPDYLRDVDHLDRAQLAIPHDEYRRSSWEDVCKTIDENQLQDFKRTPLDLRNYRKYMGGLKAQYGSVMSFIMKERVRWDNLTPKGRPFEEPEDIRVLLNDWPYGIDTRIKHVVVWVKFAFEEDPSTGDLTAESRQQIDSYVRRTFVDPIGKPENVRWFKNWSALKSVHAVEHFHVMLFDPPSDFIASITDGDEALADKIN